jgi:radical SAM superfamily enzyme YgiQ (UPF0313 family)
MRTLLISANTEQLQMPVLPMGLACVAEAARIAGHETELLNLMTRDDLSAQKLESAVSSFNPEIIGISVRNIDDQCMNSPKFLLEAVKSVVTSCRSLTSAPIVLGGAGYSIFPRSALACLGADMGIRGEGEAAFVMLLDRIARKESLAGIPNLILPARANENMVEVQPSEMDAYTQAGVLRKRLDDFPLPLPDSLSAFPTEFENQKVWLPFQTRRGCPMECSYCSTATIEGRILRKRSPKIVMDSISRFAEAGFKNFFFVDNTFNFPPSYARELCERMIERNPGIEWRCILYPWNIKEDLIEMLARAGCVDVAFGFESGSRKILRSLNKRFQPEEVRRVSEILKRHGIGRMGFVLLGGPGETRETVEQSLEFADSLELEAMKITVGIRIYPCTALASAAIAEGVVAPGDDLLFPKFYLAAGLEGWIEDRVSDWLRRRPTWHR